ncbi:hypothetical protein MJO28_011496 [Puccinia striiformis f. sp. tritici]|uniref:Uncharacterized protein n=2 Tax=Puccinia striiformis TaxID=27350 RepID=A0A2S4UTX1_9BASI|nr:hypothetical protein MJO28_011496 [Puccinia striiformis f. sp. tritici]POW00565.1 hypothetical protein PSTT_13055 [Puccinia striiformis]
MTLVTGFTSPHPCHQHRPAIPTSQVPSRYLPTVAHPTAHGPSGHVTFEANHKRNLKTSEQTNKPTKSHHQKKEDRYHGFKATALRGFKERQKLQTLGRSQFTDVSGLFPDVLKNMQSNDLEPKELAYLYLMNYAKSHPDLVCHSAVMIRLSNNNNKIN